MEIILSVLLLISMIINLVLLKYQPTVYHIQSEIITPEIKIIDEWVNGGNVSETLIVPVESFEELEIIKPSSQYSPWKNQKGIQQSFPNSSSDHKPAPPLKPLERPYGFSR